MERSGSVFNDGYACEFTEDFSRFFAKISDEVAEDLRGKGYSIIDGFLGLPWSQAILQELKWLSKNNFMKPNKTHFTGKDGRVMEFEKPNISEIDLYDTPIREKVPTLNKFFQQNFLSEALDAVLPDFMLNIGIRHHTFKLQRNAGNGGCFPVHFDNPGPPNKRKLTCILYLNPDWKEECGGELQIIPFLGNTVNIPPIMDRMVIFASDLMLHRVLPSNAERFCLTIWIDGAGTNMSTDLQLRVTQEQINEKWNEVLEILKNSPVQRVLSRGVYQEEYEQSLEECMEFAEGYGELVYMHQSHLLQMEQNAKFSNLVKKLRAEIGKDNPIKIQTLG